MDSPWAYLVSLLVGLGALIGAIELVARGEQRRVAKRRDAELATKSAEHSAH